MYESPIKIHELTRDIQQKIKQDQEEKVMECICEYGISIDKEELIKALKYDRNQYEKGFADALNKIRAEIVDLGQRTMNDNRASGIWACRDIIDKYKAESEE